MNLPEELRYTAEHLWIRAEGDLFYAGITDFDTLRPLHASLRRDYRLQQRACT